jgi:hypothetical protein
MMGLGVGGLVRVSSVKCKEREEFIQRGWM